MHLKNNRKGMAYLYVSFILLVLVVVLTHLIRLTTHNLSLAESHIKNANVYPTALSGIDVGIFYLTQLLHTHQSAIWEEALALYNDTTAAGVTLETYLSLVTFHYLSVFSQPISTTFETYPLDIRFEFLSGYGDTFTVVITSTAAFEGLKSMHSVEGAAGISYEGIELLTVRQVF